MKNRFNWFIVCVITVTLLLCVAGCQDFLIQVNSGNAIININLDLSKLIKNSRNDDTQINGYVLKLFVYDAQNYTDGDREIEKLPLITQTSNKVDVNGIVKASLEVGIDKTVIFVGKLFTLNENDIESEKPLYAGKSEVFKVQPKDNKVHLVLSREKSEIGFEIELAETHKHTFADSWSTSLSHHWKGTTCGHTDVMSEFANHSFGGWEIKDATETEVGSKERTCSVCKYKEIVEIAQLAHTHKFATGWSHDAANHWKAATCEHKDIVSDFGEHTFGEWQRVKKPEIGVDGTKERYCIDCNYNEIDVIAKIPENFVFIQGDTITGATPTWLEPVDDQYKGVFIDGRTVILSDFYMGKYEVTQEEYASVMAGQKVTVAGEEYEIESNPNYCTENSTKYTLFEGEKQGKRPVEGVTWYDALWYCNALSVKEGLSPAYIIDVTEVKQASGKTGFYIYSANVTLNKDANGYRLPTEAEWEYAARGGYTEAVEWNYVFSGADIVNVTTYAAKNNSGLDSVGWYCYNNITGETGENSVTTDVSGKGTHEVGKKQPNRLGIYDMSGNVWEWCYDWKGDVNTGTESDPTGASSGSNRVPRGGSWSYFAYGATVSGRYDSSPYSRSNDLGFRVVRPSSK